MRTEIEPHVEKEGIECYKIISNNFSFNRPLVVLHIASDVTLLMVGTHENTPDSCWQFDIGYKRTADDFFKHNPPTPAEVENAIVTVEDEVMQVRKLLPIEASLFSTSEGVKEVFAQLSSYQLTNKSVLSRSDMESVFGRLSAIISGRPASADTLPQTTSFVANLLILREVMFHLGFEAVEFC